MNVQKQIVLVDDDRDYLDILKGKLFSAGFKNIIALDDPLSAAARFEGGDFFDIAFIDMTMPGMDGLDLLEAIKTHSPRTECIMVTAVNEARVAVECLRKGAYDYLVKPVSDEDLIFSMKRTLERKRLLDILDIERGKTLPALKDPKPFSPIVTRSRAMLRILKEAELHADSDVPVLITGESGTGKELLARAIHAASPRESYPFTAVNMASLASNLFEAEFFGHTRGAFTGAETRRAGYLEHTDQGTLFLDEIGNLSIELQGKLLRVLQDGEYMKLGASNRRRVDVRFLAATNEDLEAMMAQKRFRQDLFYRIRGGWLHLPPLRKRKEDIPLLVERFLRDVRSPDTSSSVDEDAMCLLMEHDFPGNIRELQSIIHSAMNLAQGRPISPDCLPAHFRKPKPNSKCVDPPTDIPIVPLARVEKDHILKIYKHTGANKSRTARLLGIGLNTLRRKLKAYGMK